MKRMIDSELINSFGTDIKFDEMGNVTVGRNLEVGGNVFTLNGKQWGIMPIFIDNNNAITSKGYIIYSDKPTIKRPQGAPEGVLNLSLQGILVGKTSDDIGIINTEYSTSVGVPFKIIEDGLYFQDEDYYSRVISAAKSVKSIATKDNLSTLQPKLYMHQITLSDESGTSKRFQYITPRQVVANSIDNLTNLLGNMDVYLDTVQVLHKAGNAWRVVGGNENFVVSSVSDIVTPLQN